MTFYGLINEGRERLFQAGQGEQAAQVLMVELCRKKNINLFVKMNEECPEDIQTDYLEGVHEMEKGEPLGYVLGYEWFYGYDFIVNKDVLIPRPETEELVGLVLQLFDEHFSDREHITVFDVATGSGAIGITLNKEEPRMNVICSDISKDALAVTKQNNKHLQANVNVLCGNMLDPFIDRNLRCDILVCNPPYIPNEETVEHSVIDFEPHVALFGGDDGLNFYRNIFQKAHLVLNNGAFLAFEIGYNQGQALLKLAKTYFPGANCRIHQDMSQKDRMLTIEL